MGLDWRCETVCGGKRNSGVNIKKRIESNRGMLLYLSERLGHQTRDQVQFLSKLRIFECYSAS